MEEKRLKPIDNIPIERVTEYTFLGITLDLKISWKPHIAKTQSKMARCISLMGKSKHILDYHSLFIVYCTLTLPYMSYGVKVWGNTYKTNIDVLFKLQRRAIRILHNVGFRDHTDILFQQSKILKFNDLIKFKTLKIIFKAKQNLLPKNLQKLFCERDGSYNLRGKHNLKKQCARTTMKQMCITRNGVDIWNSLNEDIKGSLHLHQFKRNLKKHYISELCR